MSDRPDFFCGVETRRFVLVGLSAIAVAPAITLPGAATAADKSTVSLPKFRRNGDRDDTEALFRAAETKLPIHAPAGGGSGSQGRYSIAMTARDNLPSGFSLTGDGIGKTIFARSYARSAPFLLHADSLSSDVRNNLANFHLADLSFEDDVAALGYSEYDYLVIVSGVSNALIERVGFRGFRGDALYIGSSTIRSQERHNRQMRVVDCQFDGVTANNRNAISVLDCDGLIIERCVFRNVARTGGPGPATVMNPLTGIQTPGAIDIEPEDTGFARVTNVTIRDNFFSGGGGHAVTLNLPANGNPRAPVRTFTIERNRVINRDGGFGAFGVPSGNADIGYNITLRDNEVRNCRKPFIVDGMLGLVLQDNVFIDCTQPAEIGYTRESRDVALVGNRFERTGSQQGFGLWIRSVDGLRLDHNRFVDCGLTNGTRGIAIAFVDGESSNLELTDNLVENATGRATEAVTIFDNARVDRRTLRVRNNRVLGGIGRGTAGLF